MLEQDLYARNLPDIQSKLKCGKAAIAGLGGLGSNIAVMLARIGVGSLFLVDFDRVEPSNLNRQHYNHSHLGQFKTDALASQLELINPFVSVRTCCEKITADNAANLFADYSLVCEAFDRAEFKADLVCSMLAAGKTVVAASGMNGVGDSNLITTQRKLGKLWLCGDGLDSPPELEAGVGFMAPRVMLCAAHQANAITRILLGLEEFT
ncbi:MAG: sulfur carrier protein ThiS adenylyltransferase ThiF [Oscillospiraceae bacterium]|nr:sulfur carrier protein ThiS adenylyltransferase ThiF [Oscillospiraceae bacterium]